VLQRLALPLLLILPISAMAQDITWNLASPPGALSTGPTGNCSSLSAMHFAIQRIEITKTPNDGGDYEEWDLGFAAYPLGSGFPYVRCPLCSI
jgi:hypothetical protein